MIFLHSSLIRWILLFNLLPGGALGQQSIQAFEGCFRPIEGQDVTIKCRGTDNIDPHAAQRTSWSTTGSSFPSTITLGNDVQRNVNNTLRLNSNYSALEQKWTYDLTILNYNRSYDGNFKCELQTLNKISRMEHVELTKIPSIKPRIGLHYQNMAIVRNGNSSYYNATFVKYLVFTNTTNTGKQQCFDVEGENLEEIEVDVSTLRVGRYTVSSCYCGDCQSKGEGDTTGCYDHQGVAIESEPMSGNCNFEHGACGYVLKGWDRVAKLSSTTGPCSGFNSTGREGFLCLEESKPTQAPGTTVPPVSTPSYSQRVFESSGGVLRGGRIYNISISYAASLGTQLFATMNISLTHNGSSYIHVGSLRINNTRPADWNTANLRLGSLNGEATYQVVFQLSTACDSSCSYVIDKLEIKDVTPTTKPPTPSTLTSTPKAVTTTSTKDKNEEQGIPQGLIIGVIVGGCAVIMIVTVIIVVVVRKKNSKKGTSPRDQRDDTELSKRSTSTNRESDNSANSI